MKNYRYTERAVKGFANHRRLQILELLKKETELSVAEISERLNIDFKNAAAHVQKLAIAGLVLKRSDGHSVRHKLTDRAEKVLRFLTQLLD